MPAILIARRDRLEVSRLVLADKEVVVGRSHQVDLVLEDEDVSRRHAVITPIGGGYTVSDPGSRNGLALNGELLTTPRPLAEGDQLTIGPFTISFHTQAPTAAEPGEDENEEAATRFISQKDLKNTLPGKPVQAASDADPIQVKVELLDGPLKDAVYQNWSGDLTIGRGLDNNVVLVDDAVSIYHARIYRKGDAFCLEDLGSSNGTFLRGVRCTNNPLRNGDKIRIGVTTLAFSTINRIRQKKMRTLVAIASGVMLLLVIVISALMPDDAAELAAQQGHVLLNERKYEQAKTQFEEALRLDANNEQARSGLTVLQRRADRLRTIAEATTAMEEGRYERAVELCDIVIRNYPVGEARSARALKDAVGVFQEAIIAYDAANWPDAIRILKQLTTDYSHIQAVKQRLEIAEAENNALLALQKAREAARRLQTDIAQNLLRAVPATSRYHIEARELESALTWLRNLNELLTSDKVPELQAASRALGSEAHPLRATAIEPEALKARVDQRLVVIANALAAKGDEALQGDNRKNAHALYREALVADPVNEDGKAGLERLSAAVQAECTRLLQEAQRQESLGQRQKALEIYQKVVDRSIEGDRFNNLARRKITDLSK